MSDPLPNDWSNVGRLEEGTFNGSSLRGLVGLGGDYLMNLDDAKRLPDGVIEEAAYTKFTPMWQLLKVEDATMDKSAALHCFKWFLSATEKKAKTLRRTANQQPTHVGMNYINNHIPERTADEVKFQVKGQEFRMKLNEENFIKLYSLAYLAGFKMFFIEQRTPIFRLFMDLDFKQPEGLPAIKVEAISYIVTRSIKKFYPTSGESFFRLICCTTTYKQELCSGCVCSCYRASCLPHPECELCKGTGCTGKSKVDSSKTCEKCMGKMPVKKKTGVHLIWPEIYVTTEQCLDMRETVIADLITTFGQRVNPFNDWRDVVDCSVYNKAGLRMIGSRKTEACPTCKGKRKTDADGERCTMCGGNGHVDAGRPYAPLFVTDGSGRRDKEREKLYIEDYSRLVWDTKIRTSKDAPSDGYIVGEGAPLYQASDDNKRHKPAGLPRAGKQAACALDTPEARAIQEYFTSPDAPLVYKNVVVTSVVLNSRKASKDKEEKSYFVHVSGENSRYCHNIKRNHKSNRIYFRITQSSIFQHCHDDSDVRDPEMLYGLCKDQALEMSKTPGKLQSTLFAGSPTDDMSITSGFQPRAGLGTDMDKNDRRSGEYSVIIHNRKLQKLLYYGNKLSKDLWGCDWSTSARFASLHGLKLMEVQQKGWNRERAEANETAVYKVFSDTALGTFDDTAILQKLGFAPSEAVVMEGLGEAERFHRIKPLEKKANLSKLRDDIFNTLNRILGIALYMRDEDVVRALETKGFAGLSGGTRIPVTAAPAVMLEEVL